MSKLLYLLRTADCSGNQLLDEFDKKLQTGLSKLLNVDLNGNQCLQASLPVGNGGLGIRSGTFSLFGISLIYTYSSAVHPSWQHQPAGRPIRHIR